MNHTARWVWHLTGGAALVAACGSEDGGGGTDSRSDGGAGGFVSGTGGGFGAGGAGALAATGGAAGTVATGGVAGAGGTGGAGTGGTAGSGGVSGTGGAVATGGAAGSGGVAGAGGVADAGSDASVAMDASNGGSAGMDGTTAAPDGGADAAADSSLPEDSGGGATCSHTAPVALSWTSGPSGSLMATQNGNTNDALDRAEAAMCDGTLAGAGGDILYEISLDRTRDVAVTLDASFDGILRFYSGGCGPAFELDEAEGDGCSNQSAGAGGTTESLSYTSLPTGDYLVLVDGVTSSDRGTFTLDVEAQCNGTDELRLVEIGIGDADYAVLRNTSDCPARTEGATVLFDDAEGDDRTVELPAMTLEPGEQLRLDDSAGASPPEGVIGVDNIQFAPSRGGAVLLCLGDCNDGDNVIDAMVYDGESGDPPALPSPVDFDFPLSGIDAGNQNAKSFVRIDLDGTAPDFLASDWCTGAPGAPFAFRLEEVHLGSPDYVAIENHSDCSVSLQGYRSFFQPEVDDSQHSSWGDVTLAPGTVYYMAENISNDDVVNCCDIGAGENIAFAGDESGYVLLCRGSCNKVQNIIDVLAFDGPEGEAFPALPGTITFSPDGVSGIDLTTDDTTSYFRDSLTGGNSRFFEADWTTGAASGVPQ